MSKLHEALSSLSPTDWDSIPHDSDSLSEFLTNTFSQAELVCNSIPPPPGGSDFLSSTRNSTVGNASSASEIIHSEARPAPPAPDHAELQKSWGKPVKVAAKDNPLGITMYKMAGHDRHGAWFARRSVHEGLGFTKWKKAMQKEFGQSLAVQGGPGEGSVRGIGADQRLAKEVVEGVGSLEVFQLSAQFPGPVAPREFITCLMTTDTGLTEKSAPHGECPASSKVIPRHWMVVSVPIDHPEAPPRQGLVRGSYESVEMIREIPLTPSKSKSTPNLLNIDSNSDLGRPRGSTIGFAESRGESAKGERMDKHELSGDDPETNPVEWIMVTRSDPGGGIPRFMVERGTPASITADAAKFLDWATAIEDIPEANEEESQEHIEQHVKRQSTDYSVGAGNGHLAGINPMAIRSESTFEPSRPDHTGVIASLTSAVQTGIEAYAPNVVQNNLPEFMHPSSRRGYDSDTSSSDDSFESFDDTADFRTAYEGRRSPDPLASESDLSLFPDDSSGMTERGIERQGTGSSEHIRYEKELAKLSAKRKTLDDKMEKVRQDEEKRTRELSQKEEKDVEKTKEKIEKEKKKQESKYEKELQKLEQKKKKEARRLEDRQRKNRDKDQLSRVTRERNEYRRQVEILRRENELLHLQLGDSQNQNTLLVQKLGKTGGGNDILNAVREETRGARNRASSVGSRASKRSGETGSSKLSQEVKD